MAASVSPDEILAYEDAGRRRAAIGAFAAAALTVVYVVVALTAPRVDGRGFLASVARIGEGARSIADSPSLRAAGFERLQDVLAVQLVVLVLPGLALAVAVVPLLFLARAGRARTGSSSPASLYVPIVGAVVVLVGTVMTTVSVVNFTNAVADSDGTVGAITDLSQPLTLAAGQLLDQLGRLVLGVGFALVSINAMKVGLLTRFFGIMGAFLGVLVAFPTQVSYFVLALWLLFVGLLSLRIAPGGAVPPAWLTGQAEPWPSAAEERARRQRAAAERRGTPMPPEPAAVEKRAAAGKPHPSSKKKRKRRT